MFLQLAKTASRTQVSRISELAAATGTPEDLIRDVIHRTPDHYTSFQKKKPNGKMRLIEPPKKQLRQLQKQILRLLYSRLRIPAFLHGGLPNRSTLTHAGEHVGKRMLGTFDLQDFFPSVTPQHILPVLFEAGFAGEAASCLLGLVTFNNRLPQGAPTSSLVANLAFVDGDVKIRRRCRQHGFAYSRFVDDIAISGDGDVSCMRSLVTQVVEHAGFRLADKTFFSVQGTCQVVTGLVVNERLRPTHEFCQQLADDLRFCQANGPELLADIHGLTVAKLQAQLKGRISHFSQFDNRRARYFRRLLQYAIVWSPHASTHSHDRNRSAEPVVYS